MGSGSHCPHGLFVRIMQNLLTSWSAFRLAPDLIKSILYTEARMISPKYTNLDRSLTHWSWFDWCLTSWCSLHASCYERQKSSLAPPCFWLPPAPSPQTPASCILHVSHTTLGSLIMLASLLNKQGVQVLDSMLRRLWLKSQFYDFFLSVWFCVNNLMFLIYRLLLFQRNPPAYRFLRRLSIIIFKVLSTMNDP